MSGFLKTVSSLRQNVFACLPATAGKKAFAVLEKPGRLPLRGRKPRALATSCYHGGGGGRYYPLGGGEGHREWLFAQ